MTAVGAALKSPVPMSRERKRAKRAKRDNGAAGQAQTASCLPEGRLGGGQRCLAGAPPTHHPNPAPSLPSLSDTLIDFRIRHFANGIFYFAT